MLNLIFSCKIILISFLALAGSVAFSAQNCLSLFVADSGALIPLIEIADPSAFVRNFFPLQSSGGLTATNSNAVRWVIGRFLQPGQILTKRGNRNSMYAIHHGRSSSPDVHAIDLGPRGNMAGTDSIPIDVTDWRDMQIQAGYISGIFGFKNEFRISIYGTVVEDGAGTTSDRSLIFRFIKNKATGKYNLKFLTVAAGKQVNRSRPYLGDGWIFSSAWTWEAEFHPTQVNENFFEYREGDWPVSTPYKHKYEIAK